MKSPLKKILAAAIIAGLATPAISYATNGYFPIGYGSKSRGMGGLGIALAQDGFAAAYNPATMVDVEQRFDIGFDIFKVDAGVSQNSSLLPADENSQFDVLPLPFMGGVWKLNEEMNYGFTFVGAGLGSYYHQHQSEGPNYLFRVGDNSSEHASIFLVQMQILNSISYKIDNQNAVGATFVLGVQSFKAKGLGSFQTLGYAEGDSNFSDEGTDWSYGAGIKLGWLGSYFDSTLKVGVNYSSRVYMTEFDSYRNLFAEQGDFDIPEKFGFGIAYSATPNFTIGFDVEKVKYSDVASISNPGPTASDPDVFFPEGFGTLGQDNGLGFGWEDQTVYKLGLEYQYNDKWVMRTGLNYGKSPIPDDQILFNILAPATVETTFTLGGTYYIDETYELSFSYMHAFKNTITGKTPFYPEGVNNFSELTEDNAAISMSQNAIGATLGIKF